MKPAGHANKSAKPRRRECMTQRQNPLRQ